MSGLRGCLSHRQASTTALRRKPAFCIPKFPMREMHSQAESAAETAEFAGSHGKFWEMHDALFESQGRLGGSFYAALAEKLGLPAADLCQALKEGTYTARVR